MARPQPHHCGYCGTDWLAGAETTIAYPKVCPACANVTYRNPVPVVVGLVPVTRGNDRGLLLVRRSASQKLALPGGFIDLADADWQHAVARELREETGLLADAAADRWSAFAVRSAPDGTLLIFAEYAGAFAAEDIGDVPPANAETDRLAFAFSSDVPLAFPIHAEVMRTWLAGRR